MMLLENEWSGHLIAMSDKMVPANIIDEKKE